jgi:hypothetical protein
MSTCPKCGAVAENKLSAFVECEKCSPRKHSGPVKRHLKYASYVIRHKWFVFVECVKLGIPLRGLVHDLSKFWPSEWFPYVEYFHGSHREDSERGQEVQMMFDLAWMAHQHRNPHHWQWWVLKEDSGAVKVFEMPMGPRKEMLADWMGAGKAQGKKDQPRECASWYRANRDKMILGAETRLWIEMRLGIYKET